MRPVSRWSRSVHRVIRSSRPTRTWSRRRSAAKDRVDAVKTAKEKFAAAVNDVPNDATLTGAVDSLRDEAANLQAALSDLATEAKC